MPLSGCSSPVNPCDVEDACTPVGHTTVGGSNPCASDKSISPSDRLPKVPVIDMPEAGTPEKKGNGEKDL